MSNELDQILISYKQLDFSERLKKLRMAITLAATFRPDDVRSKQVAGILTEVAKRGDDAVAEYTERFDAAKLTPEQFRVGESDLERAHSELDKDLLAALRQAIKNVWEYQSEIFVGKKNTHPGIKYTPIRRVGICVPGASTPLPSTVIMTAVPAKVAGVKSGTVVSPPRYNGDIHPVILGICHELRIAEVYRIGGAQAIAALTFGTKTIPKVDKIVGPGNQWVQTAKKMVFGYVGIDSIAGPSELLIIANERANPAWVAADMLSQAEHAPGSAIVVTDSAHLAEKASEELKKQLPKLSRAGDTSKYLEEFSAIVVMEDMAKVIAFANEFAAEHLEIQCGEQSGKIADQIENAGAIFIGDYSPVAVGDYWAGPSHVLPTGMKAWFFSGLTSNDFIKSTSIIEYDKEKLAESAEDIIRLAEAEGLDAHAKSIKIRQEPHKAGTQ